MKQDYEINNIFSLKVDQETSTLIPALLVLRELERQVDVYYGKDNWFAERFSCSHVNDDFIFSIQIQDKYASWTRERLYQRIRELETE